jgi:enoyl-CoA hydratase/carnithine racemase
MDSSAPEQAVQSRAAAATEPEITTERSGSILRARMNRPAKKNAMTSAMYTAIADLLNDADKDDDIRVAVLHGAGDSFTAGNDLVDFQKKPPEAGDSPQARFTEALINFSKPLIAAVHGAAVGSGTTMLLHFDFVYAAENTKFQMPFVNLALVPELGSSYLLPAQAGHLAAIEVILLGSPFDARRALELGLVTRVLSEQDLLPTAMETAQKLSEKPAGALQASKRLLKRASRELTAGAAKAENQEFSARLLSADAKEAMTAFFERRRPDFTKTKSSKAGLSKDAPPAGH